MLFGSIVRSLKHRNFRLFFFGQTLSLTGSWMQQVAMSWLVFQLTGSSFLLGVVLFLGQIPCLFLPPLVGVLTEQWDRHKMLLITQTLAMLQAFVLALLALTGTIQTWHIMALAFCLGVIVAFDMPARQAFTGDMVTNREDLGNAVGLNATMFNSARLFGPALAGLILAHTSPGMCFLINGVSFFAVLISLALMRFERRPSQKKWSLHLRASFVAGVLYAWGFSPLRNILLLLGLGSLTGSVTSVLLPEYTVDVLKGDASTLSWLMASTGVGALFAALFLASRRSVLGLGKWIGGGFATMGLGILALPSATTLWAAGFVCFAIGFGLIIHVAAGHAVIQTITDEDKRGRVLSFYTVAIVGLVPIGNLISGAMATKLGLTGTMVLMGSVTLVGAAVFFLRLPRFKQELRPVYQRLKILPAALVDDLSGLPK